MGKHKIHFNRVVTYTAIVEASDRNGIYDAFSSNEWTKETKVQTSGEELIAIDNIELD